MSQNYPQDQIKDALISLLNGIKASDGAAVSQAMAVLDDIVARQGDSLPPQLGHFLERRSYAKALVWLGGEAPAAGTCGPAKSR
jgi:hypothetical protein